MLIAALMAMTIAGDAPGVQPANTAATPSTLEMFKTLCMSNDGDFSKAIAQADAFGWRTLGPRALADLPKSLANMEDGQIRAEPTPSGAVYLVFTGRNVATGADVRAGRNKVCGVVGVKVGAPDADFREAVGVSAGGPPMRSNGQQVVFVVEKSSTSTASETQKAFDAGTLKTVVALSPPGANILVYFVPIQAD